MKTERTWSFPICLNCGEIPEGLPDPGDECEDCLEAAGFRTIEVREVHPSEVEREVIRNALRRIAYDTDCASPWAQTVARDALNQIGEKDE